MSKFILDTRLSEAHYIVCTEAIRRGIIEPEDLNEGRRTMAEQWAFWRNQPPLAAFPSPTAPHIKKGFPNHDIDCNSFNGAAQRLADFYRSQGVSCSFCVRGEAWHICMHSASELRAAAKKIRKEREKTVLKVGVSGKAVKFLKYQLQFIRDTVTHKSYYKHGKQRPKTGWGTKFAEDLEKAVKDFQRDHGLKPDGVVGSKTDQKIDHVFATQKRRRKSALARARARKAAAERGEL